MNNKQIERLWRLADKLRGAFEISELYKIMLYGILLKHIEYEKEDICSYDEKYSLGYLSLTYGKLVKPNDVLDYLRKIELELGLDAGVISESFDKVFGRADSENVRILFENLNELDIESSESCYQLALVIVNKMMISAGRMGCEFGTNIALTKLEKALLDVQDGMSVYDAYCGTGISVNEVSSGKGEVFMQDMSISSIGIAAIISVLSGNRIGKVRCADSLHNPIELKGQYDRVVCEPPFSLKYDKGYMESIPEGNCIYRECLESESLALRHSIASLKDGGIAVVLVPMGMLFKSGRMGEVRKSLVDDSYIDALQRNKGCGSQTAMLSFMGDTEMKRSVLGALLGRSIAYSFRYYVSNISVNSAIKMLSINGVYPDRETIASGEYPISSNFYAVYNKANKNENINKLLDFILSEKGQRIVEQSGYIPLKK